MATAIYPLRKFQAGFETTPGTAVAATAQLVGAASYTPEIEREFEAFPRGVRAPVTGGGIAKSKGSLFSFSGNLSYEEILYPLASGLKAPAISGIGPYVHLFDQSLTTIVAPKALTLEYVIEDGTTKHFQREAAYCTTRSFEVGIAFNELATVSFELFGRAEQTSTMTAALTPVTGRKLIPSNLFTIAIDDTWAGLGGTAKSTLIRAATLKITTGLEPDYTLDGRTDLDFTGLRYGMVDGALSMTLEHNADAATEIDKWRTGALRFVRLKATDGTKIVQFDMAAKYLSPPSFSEDAGIEIATMELGLEYDATGAKAFVATITNSLAALP